MILNITGMILTRIWFEYGIGLLFEDRARIFIETDSILTFENTRTAIDPQNVGPAALQVLDLLHRTVASAYVRPDGTLTVRMETGHELSVPPSADYESWSADIPGDSVKLISMPGGDVAEY